MNLEAPFQPAGEHIGVELPGGGALFTTRRGGTSEGPFQSLNLGLRTGDEADRVLANRRVLADQLGLAPARFAYARQVHGGRVVRVADSPDGWGEGAVSMVHADGQATARNGVAAIVLTADCLPIALIAPGAVAMLHAGWRGLAAGVLAEGVAAMRELGAEDPLVAAIGPGAGRCCYEVGEEVHAALADQAPAARAGRRLDLKLIAAGQLRAAGVQEIHDVGLCTICSEPELFFSHRRDGGLTGRQGGVAWRS